jgi:putative ABC transport system permease protein
MGSQPVARGGKNDTLLILGAYPVMLNLVPYDITLGRFINELDINERRKIAVIGTRVKNVLFEPDKNPIGEYIEINNVFFKVVGIFDSRRPAEDANRDEETIMIPNTTLRYTFNQGDRIHQMMLTPKPGVRSEILEEQAKTFLKIRHKVHPDDRVAIGTFNIQERFEEVQGLHTGVRLFSWLVAIGTILAGAIGVGNIMLIVVKERTREIGIRKALGARPASIVSMIIQESLVITAVSGYMGLVIGVALLETINRVLSNIGADTQFFSNPEISFQTAFLAICILIIAGILAALMPAARAARIDPIVALQEE